LGSISTGGPGYDDKLLKSSYGNGHREESAILLPGNQVNSISPSQAKSEKEGLVFPDRPVIRGHIQTSLSLAELEEWARSVQLVLGPLVENDEHRFLALELLHHYRHLNGGDLSNLPSTEIITHKVRLAPGTRPSSLPQLRWPAHKEWWLRKIVSDGLAGGIYEHTGKIDGRLSQWNARAILVDKTENPKPSDEPRLTFDYSRVHEDLPGTYVELSARTHDNLSNPKHGCLFTADLKHGYFTVSLDEKCRHLFAFTIAGMGQLQPTRMPQGSKSAGFTMSEGVSRAFGEIPGRYHEPSLLHSPTPLEPPNLSFYTDDFFGGHPPGFFPLYWYLRKEFLPRLEWARYRLAFKKLKVWQTKVQVLGVTHEIGGKIYVLEDRIRKIVDFPVPVNVTGVRGFLGVLGITRRWISNFSELGRPLARLTGKVPWKWGECEQLSFEILKVKAATATIMHGVDLSDRTHFYTDASGFAGGMVITQERGIDGKVGEVPILYDSFTFNVTQRRYPTYKKELCAMVKLVTKYDYLAQHPYKKAVVHTDHKPLTHFLTTINDVHDGIYGHWADQLRRLNVEIRYIPGPRNKVADGLSRTIFRTDDCEEDPVLSEALQNLRDQGKLWIWSDKKDGYTALLDRLSKKDREEVIQEGTLHGVSVFSLEVGDGNSWTAAYEASEWFGDVHRFLRNGNSPSSKTFRESMSYRLDPETDILWISRGNFMMPCIPEAKVRTILAQVHDNGGHWGKAGTLAKLKDLAYWPNQSEDVAKYIAGCMECARHGPATRSQPLHPITVFHPFQLMGMDYIGPLKVTTKGNTHILHIIDYFTRYSFSFPCPSATVFDTIQSLKNLFTLYGKPMAFYTDRGTHFDAQEVRDFLRIEGISIDHSPSGASKSTGMVEVGNKLLELILRKQNVEWDVALGHSTYQLNARIIDHLGMSPSAIFLGTRPTLGSIDPVLGHIPGSSIQSWFAEVSHPEAHSRAITRYVHYRAQVYDYIRTRSDQKKEEDMLRYNRGITGAVHRTGDYVMLHQKDTAKLEPRWRGPFALAAPGGSHGISWKLRQLNGRAIRGTFHGDHLKRFIPRTGYLSGNEEPLPTTLNLRRTRKKKVLVS
jgi:hypothetical protein